MSLYHLRIIERLWGSRKFAVRIYLYMICDYNHGCANESHAVLPL